MLDINDPKVRWAQQLADRMQCDQAIVKNMFNSYDIKRASSVVIVNNPDVVAVIEPTSSRLNKFADDISCVLN